MRNDRLIRLLAGLPASADIAIWTGDDEIGAQSFEPVLLVNDMDDGKAGEMISMGEPWLGSSLGRLDEQNWGHLNGVLDQLFENMRTPEEIEADDPTPEQPEQLAQLEATQEKYFSLAGDDEPIEPPEQTDEHRRLALEWVAKNPLLCIEFERIYRRKPDLPHECRVAYALSTGGRLWMRDNDDVAWVEVRREDLADIHLDEIGPSQMHCSVPTIADWDADDGALRSWDKPGCAVMVAIRIGEWPIFSELNHDGTVAMDASCPSPYALERIETTIKRVEPFADAGDLAWSTSDDIGSDDDWTDDAFSLDGLDELSDDSLRSQLVQTRRYNCFGDGLERDYAEAGHANFGSGLPVAAMSRTQLLAELRGEDVEPEPQAVENVDDLAERLEELFWREVAGATPTADGGDWPPDPALDVKWHMRAWIAKWRRLNTPEGRTIDDELDQESALISVLPVDYDGIRAASREPWFDPQGWTEQMWADGVREASEKLDAGVDWARVWRRCVDRALSVQK